MMEVMTSIEFIPQRGKKFSTWKPIQAGLQLTTQSLLSLHLEMVVRREKLKFLMCGRLSQDGLENVFSQIRSKGVSHPKPSKFRTALKLVCLAQLLGTSRHSNYKEDDAPQLLDFVTKKASDISTDRVEEEVDPSVTENALRFFKCDCEMNGFYYVCGWTVKKVLNKVSCHACSKLLANSLSPSFSTFDNCAILTLIRSYVKNPLQHNLENVTFHLCHPSSVAFDFLKQVEAVFRLYIEKAICSSDPLSFIKQHICIYPKALICHKFVFEKIANSFIKLRLFIHSKEMSSQCRTRQFASKTAARKMIS